VAILQQLKKVHDDVARMLTKDFKLSALVARAKLKNSSIQDLTIADVPENF